jgi:hypothetical protein
MDQAGSWMAILVLVAGCAGHAKEVARAAPERTIRAAEPGPTETPQAPGESLKQADRLYTDQLGASGRDDRYVDSQVAALREAIALYEQFIEHAGSSAQYRDAVRRSRERIEDARATIDFLLAKEAPP